MQAIDLINILLRRKHLIIASAFFGLLAGASYFLLTQPSYESRAQVLVMQNDGVLSEVRGGSSRDSVSED
ncbi:MAG: Wzz/FepE/Etk N-terminal domain-containing protein, partial [bacterium]|nr:Wzz/FepE/Etk N-terminal domain-containing protein [bacterium]